MDSIKLNANALARVFDGDVEGKAIVIESFIVGGVLVKSSKGRLGFN